MRSPAAVPARDEAGWTLIEMIIAMALAALLIGAIVGATAAGWKTTDSTVERLGNSNSAQIIANWFPRDVASAAPVGITTESAASTGCSGTGAGVNVVLLPAASGPGDDQRRISYRLDASSHTIKRYECVAAGPARVQVLAREVASASASANIETDGQTTVTMVVTMQDPDANPFEITGHSRTPTIPADLPDPQTPTTAPPLPCKVDSSSATPNPVAIASGTTLTTDVTVTISVSGTCVAPMTVSLTPGSSGPPVVVAMTASGPNFVATLGKSAYSWTSGAKAVTIAHSGPAAMLYGSTSFTVSPPCTVTSATATPNPVNMGAGTALANDVSIAVTVSGLCTNPLSVSFVPGTSGATRIVPLTLSGSTYQGTLGKAAHTWAAGTKPITVIQTSGVPLINPTFDLVVSPASPCVVTSGSVTPSPVGRQSNGRLTSTLAVSITTTGTCADLKVEYKPQATTVVGTLVQSGSVWTLSIPNSAKWDAGTHPFTITGASNAFSFNLVVNP